MARPTQHAARRRKTTREKVVRAIALRRGISMVQAAQEMGILVGTLYSTFASTTPRNNTVATIYQWARRYESTIKDLPLYPVTEDGLAK